MKVGYELELLAPFGKNRRDLADHLVGSLGDSIQPIFHRESEYWPGANDSKPYFCLTKGFEILRAGQPTLKVINDMTIELGLDPNVPQQGDWYHILADDIRLIELIKKQCDPAQPTDKILEPIASLFGLEVQHSQKVWAVIKPGMAPICGTHSYMTDRHRICEVVTSPIETNHHQALTTLLDSCKEFGCTLPVEAAFHMHFDGEAFSNSSSLLRFIRYCHVWGDVLKAIIPPNPNCKRLGGYSNSVIDYAFDLQNEQKTFDQVKMELKELKPVKYCDFNFNNILIGDPQKLTVEVRVIPMIMDSAALCAANDLYQGFIRFILESDHSYEKQKKQPTQDEIQSLLSLV